MAFRRNRAVSTLHPPPARSSTDRHVLIVSFRGFFDCSSPNDLVRIVLIVVGSQRRVLHYRLVTNLPEKKRLVGRVFTVEKMK